MALGDRAGRIIVVVRGRVRSVRLRLAALGLSLGMGDEGIDGGEADSGADEPEQHLVEFVPHALKAPASLGGGEREMLAVDDR